MTHVFLQDAVIEWLVNNGEGTTKQICLSLKKDRMPVKKAIRALRKKGWLDRKPVFVDGRRGKIYASCHFLTKAYFKGDDA